MTLEQKNPKEAEETPSVTERGCEEIKQIPKTKQIRDKAFELLGQHSFRYMELHQAIHEALPGMEVNTIHNVLINLPKTGSGKVYKPEKGVFKLISQDNATEYVSQQDNAIGHISQKDKLPTIKEKEFYKSFADFLTNDLEETTEAIPLGGNSFKDKWGTPDVIGLKRCRKSDLIKKEDEVVSAEIKVDSQGLITAFGQACVYQSFSHKAYIVIPKNSSDEDKARLESLCSIFGIGLILFDSANVENPQYEIRIRPQKHEPELFYVNKYLKIIENQFFN